MLWSLFLFLSIFSSYVIGRDVLPNFLGVLACTLIVLHVQCISTFMNCLHVKTSSTYCVYRIQIEVIFTAVFYLSERDKNNRETILASTTCS